MFNIGTPELILILLVALVVVGPKKLPELGKTLGKTLREFRRATQEIRNQFDVTAVSPPEPKEKKDQTEV